MHVCVYSSSQCEAHFILVCVCVCLARSIAAAQLTFDPPGMTTYIPSYTRCIHHTFCACTRLSVCTELAQLTPTLQKCLAELILVHDIFNFPKLASQCILQIYFDITSTIFLDFRIDHQMQRNRTKITNDTVALVQLLL